MFAEKRILEQVTARLLLLPLLDDNSVDSDESLTLLLLLQRQKNGNVSVGLSTELEGDRSFRQFSAFLG